MDAANDLDFQAVEQSSRPNRETSSHLQLCDLRWWILTLT
jgi:hypothetical protein